MTLDYFYGQAGKLFSFYRIPKALFQEQRFQNLSTDAKTLYGILLDRMSLSVKNEWFDKQGRVFIIFTIEDVKRALCCADNKATKLLRELENFGLIERKRRGLGKPSLVYVKNFSSDLSNERVQNRENHESGSPKNACQDPPKSRCNKNKKSKTERNNTNPILSDELEKMKNRKLLEEYFSRSLEIELLLRLYPDDEDTIYQIVDLLVDTCDSKRNLIRIAGDDKPAEVVLSRLKKLNADHIRFVLDCLAANTSPMDASTARYHELGDSIKASEKRLAEIAVLKAHIINYAKTRPVYDAYRKTGYSKRFLETHRTEITLHKAAKAAFDEANLKMLPKVKELDAEYSKLLTEKKARYPDYRKAKEEMQELLRAKRNVEMFFAEEKSIAEKMKSR